MLKIINKNVYLVSHSKKKKDAVFVVIPNAEKYSLITDMGTLYLGLKYDTIRKMAKALPIKKRKKKK